MFLVDGFPRKQDQADAFERDVAEARAVLYFECPEKEMEKRLLDRGKTSGRVDDNIESIRKRYVLFSKCKNECRLQMSPHSPCSAPA